MKTKIVFGVIFSVLAWIGTVSAEIRTFTSTNGKSMQASLVSHKGGKVTLKRADGQEFSVAPNMFSPEDQLFIKNWMDKTPETIIYRVRVDAKKTKVSGTRVKTSYSYAKREQWAYDVEVTNASRDEASGLVVKYRVFFRNNISGSSSSSYYYLTNEGGSMQVASGTVKQPVPMGFNKSMAFQTKQVQIESYDTYYSTRRKDELLGVMVRVEDPTGNVVADWKSPTTAIRTFTWESSDPNAKNGSGNVTIR